MSFIDYSQPRHALTKRGSFLTGTLTGDKTRSQRGARGLSSYRRDYRSVTIWT